MNCNLCDVEMTPAYARDDGRLIGHGHPEDDCEKSGVWIGLHSHARRFDKTPEVVKATQLSLF